MAAAFLSTARRSCPFGVRLPGVIISWGDSNRAPMRGDGLREEILFAFTMVIRIYEAVDRQDRANDAPTWGNAGTAGGVMVAMSIAPTDNG